jgi:hypothetical protein
VSEDIVTRTDTRGTGGSRAEGGFSYQKRVTAWFAVRILAGARASGVHGLYEGPVLEVLCETAEHVDDLRVGLPDIVLVLQVKRSIKLEQAEDSPMGDTVAQFVRQHLTPGHAKDRLILTTTPVTPNTITENLKGALDRFRRYPDPLSLSDVGSEDKKNALAVFLNHARREWVRHSSSPAEEELRTFLKRCWVWTLDVREGESQELNALDMLRSVILRNPNQARSAWDSLLEITAAAVNTNTGFDRCWLEAALAKHLDGGYEALAMPGLREVSGQYIESPSRLVTAFAESADTCTWTVDAGPGPHLWLRSGPGTWYRTVSELAHGQRAFGYRDGVNSGDTTWYLLHRNDHGWAWGNGKYLKPTNG